MLPEEHYTDILHIQRYDILRNHLMEDGNVESTNSKARIKTNGVFDVLSMSLFSMTELPDWYYVSLINSEFISSYVDNFINNTSHFQINDARQLPIIIPSDYELEKLREISESSIRTKQELSSFVISSEIAEERLQNNQIELDQAILELYSI